MLVSGGILVDSAWERRRTKAMQDRFCQATGHDFAPPALDCPAAAIAAPGI
jgi:hypothetical protein